MKSKFIKSKIKNLSTADLSKLISTVCSDFSLVYIPNGNRSAVSVAEGKRYEESYCNEYIKTVNSNVFDVLKHSADLNIRYIYMPVIGNAVINRNSKYLKRCLFPVLDNFFWGADWINFRSKYKVKVLPYGNTHLFNKIKSYDLTHSIDSIKAETSNHEKITLFIGFFSSNSSIFLDMDKHGLCGYDEAVCGYYGSVVPAIDLIMAYSTISSISAAPPLLLNQETYIFFSKKPSAQTDFKEDFREAVSSFLMRNKLIEVKRML